MKKLDNVSLLHFLINLLKVNNTNIRTKTEIYSTLTIKTHEQCHGRRSGVFFENFEQILQHIIEFVLIIFSK